MDATLASPAIVAATAPLKSGDFLPWFYGPICLRRALPPAINHSVPECSTAGCVPVPMPMATERSTSQTHSYLGHAGQEDDPGMSTAVLPGGHKHPASPFPVAPLDPPQQHNRLRLYLARLVMPVDEGGLNWPDVP